MTPLPEIHRNFLNNIHKIIVGHERAIHELFVALFSGGHVLLEGVPGIAKTLLAKVLAKSLALGFSRIQFTPDLMPSDIIGTNVFNFETRQFVLAKGPVFADVLLCDEINRTPPKTQAALLEAMEERGVTIDGKRYSLGDHFFVVATQNPLEHEGTYPLPEAQLDRFFMKIHVQNPTGKDMREILDRFSAGPNRQNELLEELPTLIQAEELQEERRKVFEVKTDDKVLDYVTAFQFESQNHPHLITGISARAALCLLAAARTNASTQGRDFVTPDDVKDMAAPVLRHRLILKPDAQFEGMTSEQIMDEIFRKLTVPR